jgi:DNA repair protein RadC
MEPAAFPNGHAPAALIRDLPSADRPRERLRDYGANALAPAELLAILLRTGSSRESALHQAERLIRDFGGLDGLRRTPFVELRNAFGLGDAKAAQILAALELGVRLQRTPQDARPVIKCPEDMANVLMSEMSLLTQEEVRVLQLDTRNRLISVTSLYRGSAHTTQVRMAEMFRDAIRLNATAIAVAHNHPSGDPSPSPADVHLTKMLHQSGKLLDIDVLDHVVFGREQYVSMRNLRLGFDSADVR